jgi:hypothetical protein
MAIGGNPMDKNFSDISPEQMRRMASSPAAKELMRLLRQNHASAMESALAGAQSGDQAAVQRSLAAFLADPRAKELLEKLQEGQHG